MDSGFVICPNCRQKVRRARECPACGAIFPDSARAKEEHLDKGLGGKNFFIKNKEKERK